MDTILYNDKAHTYTRLNGPKEGKIFTSVTKFIEKFIEHEDWEKIAKKYVSARSKKEVIEDLARKQNRDVEEVLSILAGRKVDYLFVQEMWALNNKVACDFGHETHLAKEEMFAEMQEDGLEVFTNPVKNDIRIAFPLENLKNGIYSELILWSDDYEICGTSDVIEVSGNRISVRDFKTNKELKFQGFRGKKMLHPIAHLDDCNFEHYIIQLSIYAYLLELRGYEVKELVLHYTRTDTDYELPYRKTEVINMLECFKTPPKDFNIYDFLK